MSEWHEVAEFWQEFGGSLFDDAAWEKAARQVDAIEDLLELEPGCRILDLCCGPGRHALELARRGYRVLGVDRTESFLEEARRRADEEGLDLDLAHADMREFVEPDAFDAAINLNTSFGYFRDPAEDEAVARNLLASLVPGGRALIELGGKEVIARIFQRRDWREEGGDFFLSERTIRDDWSWIENRWIHVDIDGRREYSVGHRLYSAVELKSVLEEAGFSAATAFGHLDGRPYDQEAERLVVVATKP